MYLPHAGKKLNKTTIGESRANDNVGDSQVTSLEVDAGENEGSKGESAETQGRWVGELAFLDWAIETGLKFTTEGRQPGLSSGVDASHWVVPAIEHGLLVGGSDSGLGLSLELSLGLGVGLLRRDVVNLGLLVVHCANLLRGDDICWGEVCIVGPGEKPS